MLCGCEVYLRWHERRYLMRELEIYHGILIKSGYDCCAERDRTNLDAYRKIQPTSPTVFRRVCSRF